MFHCDAQRLLHGIMYLLYFLIQMFKRVKILRGIQFRRTTSFRDSGFALFLARGIHGNMRCLRPTFQVRSEELRTYRYELENTSFFVVISLSEAHPAPIRRVVSWILIRVTPRSKVCGLETLLIFRWRYTFMPYRMFGTTDFCGWFLLSATWRGRFLPVSSVSCNLSRGR